MNIIRLGTRFINLDRVIDAELCLDEKGQHTVLLRYVVADADQPRNSLMSLQITGSDAAALEAYLNECGVVLTAADPEPIVPCEDSNDTPMPTILEL